MPPDKFHHKTGDSSPTGVGHEHPGPCSRTLIPLLRFQGGLLYDDQAGKQLSEVGMGAESRVEFIRAPGSDHDAAKDGPLQLYATVPGRDDLMSVNVAADATVGGLAANIAKQRGFCSVCKNQWCNKGFVEHECDDQRRLVYPVFEFDESDDCQWGCVVIAKTECEARIIAESAAGTESTRTRVNEFFVQFDEIDGKWIEWAECENVPSKELQFPGEPVPDKVEFAGPWIDDTVTKCTLLAPCVTPEQARKGARIIIRETRRRRGSMERDPAERDPTAE